MTLVEFLTARLDEDYMAAKLATPGPWHAEEDGRQVHAALDEDGITEPVVSSESYGYYGCANLADGWHIARHDPARVLAEVEAKRWIVKEMKLHEATGGACAVLSDVVLGVLALPYAGHPDCQEEWDPQPNG